MMKKFVLAGSYEEFKLYYPKPKRDVAYLSATEQLYGHRDFVVERVGTWYRLDMNFLERVICEENLREAS